MMLKVIILSLLAEAIWENLKLIFQNGKFDVNRLGSLIVSIIICIATKVNLFEILDFEIVQFIGSFFTGILISRGANVLHDLLNKIQALSKGD